MLPAQIGIADLVERLAQRGRIVAAVVLPAQRRPVRKLLGLDEVLHPQLGRIHVQLQRQGIHHAFDGVDRLGDAERAAIGDSSGRLVGVDTVNLDVRRRHVIRAGANGEQSGRKLRRIGSRVGSTVVGDRLDAQRLHLAIRVGGQLGANVVVAREGVRLQVFAAVLDPLHRTAGGQRCHHRTHVAWIDRNLATESATDIG